MDLRTQQLLNEAQNALRAGKLQIAQSSLQKVLRDNPSQIDALLFGAHLARIELQFDTARDYLKKALQQAAININHLKILAQQLSHLALYFLLAETLQKLVVLEPNNSKIWYQLGLCLARIGKMDPSINALNKSLELDKSNHLAIINLGHAYKAKGQSELAAKHYHRFINMQASMIGTGYWSLADLKDYRFSQQDISIMKETITNHRIDEKNVKEVGLLNFALARAEEQKKDYSASVAHLNNANQKISQTRPFKLSAYQQLVQAQLSIEPKVLCETHKESSAPTPIFIVGMPRSGTTLAEQILGSHTDITTSDELPFIERIAMQLCKGQSYTQGLANITLEQRVHFADYYLDQVREYTGGKHKMFVDKNPTNFLHIALIKCLFPHAKIIALLRDPVDNAMSVYKQHFSQGNDFSFQLSDIIEYTTGYFSLLKHWQTVLPKQIYHLPYQTLVTEPECSIKSLLVYCGVEFQAQCLHFYESDRPVLTPSVSQVRQPITNKALGSGDNYLPFIQSLMPQFELLRVNMSELN